MIKDENRRRHVDFFTDSIQHESTFYLIQVTLSVFFHHFLKLVRGRKVTGEGLPRVLTMIKIVL